MRGPIHRRKLLGLLAAAGAVGTAGCTSNDDPADAGSVSADDGDGSAGTDEPATTEEPTGTEEPTEGADDSVEAFDFPPGADQSGLVTETVIAGMREALVGQDRYRVAHRHEFDYRYSLSDSMTVTYDVGDDVIHERRSRSDVAVDRWIQPAGIVCRSAMADGDRTERWRVDVGDSAVGSGDRFRLYPFEQASAGALLAGPTFSFDRIVTRDERSYARYTGNLTWPEGFTYPQWGSARVAHEPVSVSEGTVAVLLGESGAVGGVEYELSGEVAKLTHEGRKAMDAKTAGEVRFRYADLEPLAQPDWAASADDGVRAFESGSEGENWVYDLAAGPALPGAPGETNARFHVLVDFGDGREIVRHVHKTEFDDTEQLYVGLGDDGLRTDRTPVDSRRALRNADRIDMSVHLWTADGARMPVFYERVEP